MLNDLLSESGRMCALRIWHRNVPRVATNQEYSAVGRRCCVNLCWSDRSSASKSRARERCDVVFVPAEVWCCELLTWLKPRLVNSIVLPHRVATAARTSVLLNDVFVTRCHTTTTPANSSAHTSE